jgi:chromosome segregation ATPase
MNEEERRLEVLKAEAAICELAKRMAEASACTKQADNAGRVLETEAACLKELNCEFKALIENQKREIDEEHKSLDQARESLSIGAKDLQDSKERLEKMAENFRTHLEDRNQEFQGLLDTKLNNLPQDIKTIHNELLFLIDQNEAFAQKILDLQQSVEEILRELQRFEKDAAFNSDEIHALRSQFNDSNERLSSLEHAFEAKTCGLSNRLRSALIGGGLGLILVLMVMKLG